ncbi:MAG: hypothetical protein OEY16_12695, partial [Alphaproteobacteria bacterium]|nr:hypothetical protein [Alphaproteobacteria bacterium]
MNWNIKSKLFFMGAATAIAMGILVWLFFDTAKTFTEADDVVEKELVHLEALVDLRLAGKELILAAMDTLVDKSEGRILDERRQVIEGAITQFRNEADRLMEAAIEAGEAGNIKDGRGMGNRIMASIDQLQRLTLNEMSDALRLQSEAEFDRLDGAIDKTGDQLDSDLDALQTSSLAELRTAMDSVDGNVQASKDNAITFLIVGLLIMAGIMGYLGRSITGPIAALTK